MSFAPSGVSPRHAGHVQIDLQCMGSRFGAPGTCQIGCTSLGTQSANVGWPFVWELFLKGYLKEIFHAILHTKVSSRWTQKVIR